MMGGPQPLAFLLRAGFPECSSGVPPRGEGAGPRVPALQEVALARLSALSKRTYVQLPHSLLSDALLVSRGCSTGNGSASADRGGGMPWGHEDTGPGPQDPAEGGKVNAGGSTNKLVYTHKCPGLRPSNAPSVL